MFVPSEPMYSAAISLDPALFEDVSYSPDIGQ